MREEVFVTCVLELKCSLSNEKMGPSSLVERKKCFICHKLNSFFLSCTKGRKSRMRQQKIIFMDSCSLSLSLSLSLSFSFCAALELQRNMKNYIFHRCCRATDLRKELCPQCLKLCLALLQNGCYNFAAELEMMLSTFERCNDATKLLRAKYYELRGYLQLWFRFRPLLFIYSFSWGRKES